MIAVDFETYGIETRPDYPPIPVGVALWERGKARYLAWGHPTGNNCAFDDAKREVARVWASGDDLLFHNAKFDIDVAETHMGVPRLPWKRYHDTMFLLFLDDPHADTFSLKPSAERLLHLPPEEQDAVKDWLVAHQPVEGKRITYAGAGAFIAYAPGDLVAKYAKGDVTRTWKLHKLLYPRIVGNGMLDAYNRERGLLPFLLDNERQGIRVDVDRLAQQAEACRKGLKVLDARLLKLVGDINIDSGPQLAEALLARGLVDDLPKTKKGNYQTDKNTLEEHLTDPLLSLAFKCRSRFRTYLGTFIEPWLATASRTGGIIHTSWNQVRQSRGEGGIMGAATGRFSSTPNFQNIPRRMDVDAGTLRKAWRLRGLPAIPKVRECVVPWEPDHVLLGFDFSQQELRILAHFEDGALLEQYRKNPDLDVHNFARDLIHEMAGLDFPRETVKPVGFGLIYGMGVKKLARSTGLSLDDAKALKDAYLGAFPGIRDLYADMRARMIRGEPYRTWGGRLYYCEAPKVVDGETWMFDYKMPNGLIQGSGADCTKEALVRLSRVMPKDMRFYLSVHDEVLASSPKADAEKHMALLKRTMESVEFDVPMLADGKRGDNWGNMEKEG